MLYQCLAVCPLRKYALLFLLLTFSPFVNAAVTPPPALSEPSPGALTNAMAQIAALQAEASALSPTQRKLASTLREALREHRGIAPRAYAPKPRSTQKLMPGARVTVDIRGRISNELVKLLEQQGGNIQNKQEQYGSIRVELPIDALETVAAQADVRSIHPAEIPLTNVGTATSEGDVGHQANVVRNNYGVTGAGVKVGVISDSVRNLDVSQANGDLGTVYIINGQTGNGGTPDTGEGTAMLEIVHDLAPGADLYFAAGNGGPAAMAANIVALADAGCDIIIDDMSYYNSSPFQDNVLGNAVKTVSDRGILYFSSAGNSGNFNQKTSGTWRGDFSPAQFSPGLGTLHNWGGSVFNAITNQGNGLALFWSDPLGASTNDYNLFVTDSAGNVLRQSVTVQNGTQDPYEIVAASTNKGEYAVVALVSGASRYLYLDTIRGRLAYCTPGNTRGHNASGAENAFCVAAASARLLTHAFTGGANNPVEPFSSDGNPRIFFEPDGTPVTPGDFSSTGGRVLQKPDITAADGVIASTTFSASSGFRPFYGTSAAAPHAGAIAALIKSYNPTLTPAQIRAALMNTALDIAGTGFDRDSGVGIIMADRALQSVLDTNPPVVSFTVPYNGQIFTTASLPNFSGTAVDSETGISSVDIFLFRNDAGGGFLYWNGYGWTSTPTNLPTAYSGGTWTAPYGYSLPSGANLPNGTYQVQVSAHNNTHPNPGTGGLGINFVVDVHPFYTWTAGSYSDGDPNNNNNLWNNPANWSPYGVPTSDSVVSIGSDVDATQMGSFSVYGLTLTGGTLTGGYMGVKLLTVSGGTFAPTSVQIADNGTFNWTGGTLSSGTFNNPVTGNTTISSFNSKTLYGATFNNSGTVTWTGGDIYGQACVINNGPTGLWDSKADATLNLYVNYSSGQRAFVNHGIFRKSAGSDTYHQGSFTSDGVIDVQSGHMNFYDALNLNDGSVTGTGSVRLLNGCCGITAVVSGTTTVSGNFELTESNTILGGNGTFNVVSGGSLKINSGYVGGTVALAGSGTLSWTGGGFLGTNSIASASTVSISGSATKYLGSSAILNNFGTIVVTGTGLIYQDGRTSYGHSPATINNQSGAVFNVLNSGGVFNYDGTASVFNNMPGALFLKAGDTNTTQINSFVFNNSGDIQCNAGTLAFIDAFQPVYLNDGSRLLGNGAIGCQGLVYINGRISAQAPVQLLGGYLIGSTNTPTYSGSGVLTWLSGTISGTLNLETNVVMNAVGSANKILDSGAVVNNRGTVNWSDGTVFCDGRLNYGRSPATWNNLSNAVFNALTDTLMFSIDGAASTFNNLPGAKFIKAAGTNATTFGYFTLNNQGQLVVATGTLDFNGSVNLNSGLLAGGGKFRIMGGSTIIQGTNIIDAATCQLMIGGTVSGIATNNATLVTTNGGSFEWAGGIIDQTLSIAANSTFNITSNSTKYFSSGAVLNNSGSVTWTGTGDIFNDGRSNYGLSPATWNNLAGAVFTAASDATMSYNGTPSTFNNQAGATFRKTADTGSTTVAWYLNNAGILSAQSGNIDLSVGGSGSGSFVSDNGTIRFMGGVETLLAGASFSGTGKAQVNGGTVTASGNVNLGSGNASAVLELINGTLNGTGNLVGHPVLNWTGGTITGTQYVSAGSVFNIAGSGPKYFGSGTVLNNAGTINWTGPGNIYAFSRGSYGEIPSTINNLSGAIFRMQSDGQPFYRNGDYCTFNNQAGALFVKSGGTNETDIDSFILNNQGEIRAETGLLVLRDYATLSGMTLLNGASRIQFTGNITVSNDVTAVGSIELANGYLFGLPGTNGNGTCWVLGNSSFDWTGGTLSGPWTIGSNTVLNVKDLGAPSNKYLGSGSVLNNDGTINWSGAGPIYTFSRAGYNESPSTINNRSNATFRVLNDGTVFARNGDYETFNNQQGAHFIKVGGTNIASVDSFIFNNNGEVRCEAGTLWFDDIANFNSNSMLQANSLIRFSGNIALNSIVPANGTFLLDNGTLTAAGSTNGISLGIWTGTNTLQWTGGTISGNMTIGSNVQLNIFDATSTPVSKYLANGAKLNNLGTINWSGPGNIYTFSRYGYNETPSTINNLAGAKFQMLTDGTVFARNGDPEAFNNLPGAVFAKTGGTNSTIINSFTFNNAGEARATMGTLEFNEMIALTNGASFTDAGSHLISAGTHSLRGTAYINGTKVSFTNGYFQGASNAVVATTGGGTFDWSGGTLGGEMTLSSGSSMTISGSANKTFDSLAVFHNQGSITWSGSGSLFCDARYGYGLRPCTFNNEAGAVFLVQNDSGITTYGTPSTFNNQAGAIFRKDTATGTSTFDWAFNNTGVIDLRSGSLSENVDLALNSASALSLTVGQIAGPAKVIRNGVLNLAGTLKLNLANGVVPTNGNSFTLVSYTSSTGQFGSLDLPSLPKEYTWSVVYGANALVASVVQATVIQNQARLADGAFRFDLSGSAASAAIFQASQDLQTWVPLMTNSPFTGAFNFTDPQAAQFTNRFYRVLIVP